MSRISSISRIKSRVTEHFGPKNDILLRSQAETGLFRGGTDKFQYVDYPGQIEPFSIKFQSRFYTCE